MAHASSLEKAVLQMKKVRKMKNKRKLAENLKKQKMTEEDYEALRLRRYEKSLKDKVQTIMWDYQHNQYSPGKIGQLKELLNSRLIEIQRNAEEHVEKELKQIEAILNELSRY